MQGIINNSDANTGKLVAGVIKKRSNNHLDKYDLGKGKTGLAKGRDSMKSRIHALGRVPPAKVSTGSG